MCIINILIVNIYNLFINSEEYIEIEVKNYKYSVI